MISRAGLKKLFDNHPNSDVSNDNRAFSTSKTDEGIHTIAKKEKIIESNAQSSSMVTLISKDQVCKPANEDETNLLREKFNISNFIAWIIQKIKQVFNCINVFAYFNDKVDPIKGINQTEQVQNQVEKPTPEKLSQVARYLAKLLLNAEILNTKEIFRGSANSNLLDNFYNELIKSTEHHNLPQNDNMLLAALFKKVYNTLDLFGSSPDLSKQLLMTGKTLMSVTDEQTIIDQLKNLANLLTEDRKKDLQLFIRILYITSIYHKNNNMKTEHLAVVAGINIFSSLQLLSVEDLALNKQREKVAELFIIHCVKVFKDIPSWPEGNLLT